MRVSVENNEIQNSVSGQFRSDSSYTCHDNMELCVPSSQKRSLGRNRTG